MKYSYTEKETPRQDQIQLLRRSRKKKKSTLKRCTLDISHHITKSRAEANDDDDSYQAATCLRSPVLCTVAMMTEAAAAAAAATAALPYDVVVYWLIDGIGTVKP